MSTDAFVGATFRTFSRTVTSAGLRPTISSKLWTALSSGTPRAHHLIAYALNQHGRNWHVAPTA
jgi:hypothetical protein